MSCPKDTRYDTRTGTCEKCPYYLPILNGNECVACPDNSHYVKESKVCMMCPVNTTFDAATVTCASKPVIEEPECSTNGYYDYQSMSCKCPFDRPHDTGRDCINCESPYFWDATKKICAQCADGLVYNEATQECQSCPINAPFEKDGVCIGCPLNTHYDKENSVCIKCGEG